MCLCVFSFKALILFVWFVRDWFESWLEVRYRVQAG